MEFFIALKNSTRKHWIEGLKWLGFNVVCGLMPIWITPLVFRFFKQSFNFGILTNNGEFALYSASFLGTALYVVLRDIKETNFPSRTGISLLLMGTLTFSAIVFSFVVTAHTLNGAGVKEIYNLLDKDFLRDVSILLLPIVCFVTFLIFVVEMVYSVHNSGY